MPKIPSGITRTVLLSLAAAGVLTVAFMVPNFSASVLRHFVKGENFYRKKEGRKKLASAFYRLKKSRLIILKEQDDGKFTVELSEKGKRKVREIQLQTLFVAKPSRWDGIWRVVIFDIPDKKKIAREALRERMKRWNFYQLQKSVWVCPWPCEKEIEFIVELFQIYPFVNVIKAKVIKDDVKLRAYFNLL
ncbi:MAG: hypothetical protein HYW95_01150 [Candidatus Wildermuthbacteria bacterium]|nr:hypothetical protein [Candidatus Wildermuthbacteria bacterium]